MITMSELIDYKGHLVQTGIPYDDNRLISEGSARDNKILGSVTVREAFDFIRSAMAKKWVEHARAKADEMVDVFKEMLENSQDKGINLDRHPGTFGAVAWKAQKLIASKLSLLYHPFKEGKADKELKKLAWSTCKVLYLDAWLWVGTFGTRDNNSALEPSGICTVDFDGVNEKIEDFRAKLDQDPLIFGHEVEPFWHRRQGPDQDTG